MSIYAQLKEAMLPKAEGVTVETLSIGLGYTCACTSDGGLGLAFTPKADSAGCSMLAPNEEYEGAPAAKSLDLLGSDRDMHRTIGLAVANALNHARAKTLPEDDNNNAPLFDALGIGQGTRVAMVGCFTPILGFIKARGAELEIVDRGKGMGDEEAFKKRLGTWAQAVILTSTSIVNGSFPEVIACVPEGVRVAMLGPSTPLIPEAFKGLPVHVLAGTVPLDREATLKAVRNAKGTPVIQRTARKAIAIL